MAGNNIATVTNKLPVAAESPLLESPDFSESNPAAMFLARYHGITLKTHTGRLRRIARLLGSPTGEYLQINWQAFTELRLMAFLNALYEPYIQNGVSKRRSPNTLNGFLATIRGVLKQAFKNDLISHKNWISITETRPFRNTRPPAGRMAKGNETSALEDAFDALALTNPAKAARDRAIMRLPFLAGVRRHEVVLLDVSAYDRLQETLLVTGKGGKVVNMELSSQVVVALDEWLKFRGHAPGALFFRISKAGKVLTQHPLTSEGVRHIFAHYVEVTGIDKLTPHDGRRTFGSTVLDDPDIDPKTAMDLMRHSSFNTTAIYDLRPGRKRKMIADRLSMRNNTSGDDK